MKGRDPAALFPRFDRGSQAAKLPDTDNTAEAGQPSDSV